MKKAILAALLGLCFALAACGKFSNEDAPIAAKNESQDNINLSLSVGGVTKGIDLGPHASSSTVIEIPVARRPVGNGSYGPSQVDRITDIQVSAYNLTAKVSSRTQICQAGAKVTTSIVYANFPTDRGGYIQCNLLDAYGKVVHPNDIDPTYAGVASRVQQGGSQ